MDVLFSFLFLISLGGLVLGLIKPGIFKSILKDKATRKGVGMIFGGAALVSFIMVGVFAEPVETPETPDVQQVETRDEQPADSDSQDTSTDEAGTDDQTEGTEVTTDQKPETQQDANPDTQNNQNANTAVEEVEQEPEQTETVSQKNAVRQAKSYLAYTAFSYTGLISQLEYEGYSNADATYGADNSSADWFEQAAKKAAEYVDYSAFSRSGLISQLEYEGFTQAQAEHGADAVGL